MPISFTNLPREIHLELACYLGGDSLASLGRGCRGLEIYNCELFNRDLRGKSPTALYWGVENGRICVIKRSVEAGANVDFRLHNGCTMLHEACARGNSDVVRTLLELGCNVRLADEVWCNSAVHFACRNGHIRLIPVLLSYGADLEARDSSGRTPFKAYLKSDHFSEEGAQQLLDYGANKSFTDSSGNTLLHFENNIRVIRFLILQGLDINARNEFGSTPLHTNCFSEPEAVQTLIKAEAKVHVINNKKEMPLDIACDGGQLSIVELLVNKMRLGPQTQNRDRHSSFRVNTIQQWHLSLHLIYRIEDENTLFTPELFMYKDWKRFGCQVCSFNTSYRTHNISDCIDPAAEAVNEMLETLDKVRLSQRIQEGFCNICGVDWHPTSNRMGKYDCEWETTIRGMFAALYTTRKGYWKELLVQYAEQTSSINISIESVMIKWLAEELPTVNGSISRLAYISFTLWYAYKMDKKHGRPKDKLFSR